VATVVLPGDLLVYPWLKGKPGHIAIVVSGLSYVFGPKTEGETAAEEALKWINKGIYHLGAGGWKPGKTTPLDSKGRCDCSGFAYSWCYKQLRYDVKIDTWWNTTAIYNDAMGKQTRFELIKPDSDISKLSVVHCHGPSPTAKRPNPPPAISLGTGLLWKKKNGIVCRPHLTNS